MVSTLTARSTSSTEMVPIAEERRPAKGYTSGPHWHCALMFTRQVQSAHISKSSANSAEGGAAPSCEVKMAVCWPKCIFLSHSIGSWMLSYGAMGITGPNCSAVHNCISAVTGYRTVGAKSVRSQCAPPDPAFSTCAPFATASSVNCFRKSVPVHAIGVTLFFPKGRPTDRPPMAAQNFWLNVSAILRWAMMSLMAVHRWPLKDVLPARHSFTARSMSASGITMAKFFASRDNRFFKRCGCGCALTSASAAFEEPMKAKISTSPDSMQGGIVSRPRPETKFTTPAGKHSA
mmetsp:Transcript_61350/g.146266  ORF Transcript_61350/g.146266 Transcript_61350/m.146266 type:complete len:290 (-) Transcript_61350:692-1561(-)